MPRILVLLTAITLGLVACDVQAYVEIAVWRDRAIPQAHGHCTCTSLVDRHRVRR